MREFERAFRRSPSGIAKRRRELILKRNPVQLLGFGVRHALPNRLDLGFFYIAFVSPSLSPAMAGRLLVGLGSKRRPKLCYGFIYFLTTFLRVIFILFFSYFSPLLVCFHIRSLSFYYSMFFLLPASSQEQHFSSMDEVKAAVRNCFRKQDGKSYR